MQGYGCNSKSIGKACAIGPDKAQKVEDKCLQPLVESRLQENQVRNKCP